MIPAPDCRNAHLNLLVRNANRSAGSTRRKRGTAAINGALYFVIFHAPRKIGELRTDAAAI
jgi:hypothetical protein